MIDINFTETGEPYAKQELDLKNYTKSYREVVSVKAEIDSILIELESLKTTDAYFYKSKLIDKLDKLSDRLGRAF